MSSSPESGSDAPSLAHISWDDEGHPLSIEFDDFYFSTTNGLEETRYIFLQHSDLAERWQALNSPEHTNPAPINNDRFVIAETGFGTGLNFLAAWQLWQQTAPDSAQLHFISTELYPVSHADLKKALTLWPELSHLSEALIEAYPATLTPGFHRLQFAGGRVQLTLMIGEASDCFSQLLSCSHPGFEQPQHKVDAWFLDGFTPAKNPQMWTQTLFDLMARLSSDHATVATFTSARVVKDGLTSAGFSIEKVSGFGLKREMLRAAMTNPFQPPAIETFDEGAFNSPYPAPWWVKPATPMVKDKHALIIGGGMAGCHTAHALANRGWKITLIEKQPQLAQQGSGNPQGVLYAKLSAKVETLSEFNLTALQFAQRFYQPYWGDTDEQYGERCGVMQIAADSKSENQQQKLMQRLGEQSLVRYLDQQEASGIAGIDLVNGGLFFPQAGWLNPASLCQQLVSHPNITVITGRQVNQVNLTDDQQWQATDEQGQLIAQASTAIICNANDARQLAPTAYLPLKPVRGQVSYLNATASSSQLKTVLCGEGYIAPAHHTPQGQQHCLGASFGPKQTETDLRELDHQQNLERLQPLSNLLVEAFGSESPLQGRAALRATTPDYLPMVGAVADVEQLQQRFSLLSKNAKASIPASGPVHQNLYVNVGHGSRGLCYTPLCAELLASQIHGDPPPLSWQILRALHPSRFLIRDLIRNRG